MVHLRKQFSQQKCYGPSFPLWLYKYWLQLMVASVTCDEYPDLKNPAPIFRFLVCPDIVYITRKVWTCKSLGKMIRMQIQHMKDTFFLIRILFDASLLWSFPITNEDFLVDPRDTLDNRLNIVHDGFSC
mmetsp:Transcript_41151/g.96542  ORF Transcript_41151/g.96542 Transcript_41151/m.96542 type:complete len:129 (+) Transcript_41151:891-1277(+)